MNSLMTGSCPFTPGIESMNSKREYTAMRKELLTERKITLSLLRITNSHQVVLSPEVNAPF
jgi:hypothetical protein